MSLNCWRPLQPCPVPRIPLDQIPSSPRALKLLSLPCHHTQLGKMPEIPVCPEQIALVLQQVENGTFIVKVCVKHGDCRADSLAGEGRLCRHRSGVSEAPGIPQKEIRTSSK